MARTKKTDDKVIESVDTTPEETVETVPVETAELTIEAVDLNTEVNEPVQDHSAAIKDLLEELAFEADKLGNIAHLFYVEQGRQRILALVNTLKTYL